MVEIIAKNEQKGGDLLEDKNVSLIEEEGESMEETKRTASSIEAKIINECNNSQIEDNIENVIKEAETQDITSKANKESETILPINGQKAKSYIKESIAETSVNSKISTGIEMIVKSKDTSGLNKDIKEDQVNVKYEEVIYDTPHFISSSKVDLQKIKKEEQKNTKEEVLVKSPTAPIIENSLVPTSSSVQRVTSESNLTKESTEEMIKQMLKECLSKNNNNSEGSRSFITKGMRTSDKKEEKVCGRKVEVDEVSTAIQSFLKDTIQSTNL